MPKTKPKRDFRLDFDSLPVRSLEEVKARDDIKRICREAEFPISNLGQKRLAREIEIYKAYKKRGKRPTKYAVYLALIEVATAGPDAKSRAEQLDDVSAGYLIELCDGSSPTSFDGIRSEQLANLARLKASEIKDQIKFDKWSEDNKSNIPLDFFIYRLAEIYYEETGKKAAANTSASYENGAPESPFVRFARLCMNTIDPDVFIKKNGKLKKPSSFAYFIRGILRAKKLCPITQKRCSNPQPKCPIDLKNCPLFP